VRVRDQEGGREEAETDPKTSRLSSGFSKFGQHSDRGKAEVSVVLWYSLEQSGDPWSKCWGKVSVPGCLDIKFEHIDLEIKLC